MAVSHKDLTGTDLHEVKGASTATSGQVPVANGSGGAPFGLLTHTSLTTTGNPFGAQLFHVREEQGNGWVSSTPAANGYNTVVLNTVKTNEISGASLTTNQLVLPAGTYYIEAHVPSASISVSSGSTATSRVRLYNSTLGSTTLLGSPAAFYHGGGSAIGALSGSVFLRGRFTLAGSTALVVQVYYNSIGSSPKPISNGETEVYADVVVWKLA